jgi:hypothetical protein
MRWLKQGFRLESQTRLPDFWRMKVLGLYPSLCLAGILFCTQTATGADAVKVPLPPRQQWVFTNSDVLFDSDFSGSRLNDCELLSNDDFKLTISPENRPINPSPWFAFKVSAEKSKTITLHFLYTSDGPRGIPWLSTDGRNWTRAAKNSFARGPQKNMATLQLNVGKERLWVAAWDMLGLDETDRWIKNISRLPFVRSGSAGLSVENRPLRDFVVNDTTNLNYVFVIGRQHPPEITGSIGLMSFMDTVTGDSQLARRFRHLFQVVVIPVVNPDGVEHGQWRSNLGGVDLNRDWEKFSQPETTQLRDFILRYAHAPGAQSALFVDFHSTGTNIFYGVPQDKTDASQDFEDNWLSALKRDCPEFQFVRDDAHNSGEATSKAWAHAVLHCPAITCEFSYDTDRALLRKAARIEAEDMMKLLLSGQQNPAVGQ